MLESLTDFIRDRGMTISEAAISLRLSLPQLSRIVNGHIPIGWSLVGRAFYYWGHVQRLPGAEDLSYEMGRHISEREQGTPS
jgi:hypothetical protein